MSSREMEANRAQWDRRVPLHLRSAFYDVQGFRAGRNPLRAVEISEIGDVSGRSLLHLQCHFGLDSLAWARLGASVVGVDFSEPAIEAARDLAAELGLDAEFVCSNIYDLRLDRQFDVVYTAKGVLTWLPDLEGWASVIAAHLASGGLFYIYESHPVQDAYEEKEGELVFTYPYFGSAIEEFGTSTYAEPAVELEPMVQYEWMHPLGEVVTALAGAGLRIEFLHEFPFGYWRRFHSMVRDDQGRWRFPGDPIPLAFSLRAKRP